MGTAFIQKLVWSVLGIGVYALAAWPPMAPVAGQLILAAGGMLISPWIPRPGDGELIAAGKEAKRASLKPPPAAGALLVLPFEARLFLLLIVVPGMLGTAVACAGTPDDAAIRNRIAANDLRDTVNEASDVLAQAHGALPFICAYFGEHSAACKSLEDGYRVTASAVDTVHRAIDLLDALGVGAEQTRTAAETVLSEAKAFGGAVQRTGEEVANAVANEADRSGGGLGGASAEQPAEQAAPAEDAGAPAADAE